MNDTYDELGRKFMDGEITLEEFINEYNTRVKKDSEKASEPIEPHEHI